jgi:hypothetical protein
MSGLAMPGWLRAGEESEGEYNDGYVIRTYRYARLAIVIAIFALVVSILWERADATCWNDSISSYYYTPVHSIFVAALIVLGVSLFTIRGGTVAEQILLNMAGFLGPVVALQPTGWSSNDCPSNLTTASKLQVNDLLAGNQFFAKFSNNNLLALIIGGFVAVSLTFIITTVRRLINPQPQTKVRTEEIIIPVIGSALLVGAGIFWRWKWPASFRTHAHSYSAIFMFVLVGFVMYSAAWRGARQPYRSFYWLCPSVMLLGMVGVVTYGGLNTWHHEVLVLEIVELIPFVVFWFVQTIELWDYRRIVPPTPPPPPPPPPLIENVVNPG